MDDVRDGLNYAWKEAMRGVKKGYKLTKSALKSIPVSRLRVPGAGSMMSPNALRRLFQAKYGAEITTVDGACVAAAEVSDNESEEEEPLTDEQVYERVDKKYFDKSYDAMKYEITRMEVKDNADDAQQQQRERQAIESFIRELRLKCDVVSTTLKKRVLANHKSFVAGVEEIRLINDGLLQTSSDCKKGRSSIRKAKGAAAELVRILAHHRRRANCRSALSLLDAMQQLCWRRAQLQTLIDAGKLVEAAELLREHGDVPQEAQIRRLFCMAQIIDQWKEYRDRSEVLRRCQENAIEECLTTKFIPSKYRNALEASAVLGTADSISEFVALTLWQSAVHILTKSLTEVSNIKEEDAPIDEIAAAVHPDHLMLCLCQACARLLDFFFLFATLQKMHEDGSRAAGPHAALHADALRAITGMGRKIGLDLVEKMALVLHGALFDTVSIDRVLHIFFVVSMLIEAVSVLGLEKSDQAAARARVKASLVRYVARHFQQPKAEQILQFMADDLWVASDVRVMDLNTVAPLRPESYRQAVREVKAYVSDAAVAAPEKHENPFYSTHMLVLQDTARALETEPLSACLARSEESDGTDAAAAAAYIGTSLFLTSSSVALANTLFEYVARIVVRFPPLATETLGWAEDLVALYMYTVADNFVSISRAVPLEHQGDLSTATQALLVELRSAAERAAGVAGTSSHSFSAGTLGQKPLMGPQESLSLSLSSPLSPNAPSDEDSQQQQQQQQQQQFPPRVWGGVRGALTSAAQQYAMANRAVAAHSSVSLTYVLEAAARSVAPLLPHAVTDERLRRCRAIRAAGEELLHVGLHRLCQAIFPMEAAVQAIAKLRGSDAEVRTSAYVEPLIHEMLALDGRRCAMPTPKLEGLYRRRFVFAVQCTLLREYCKHARRRLSDSLIMQMSVDVQCFQQQVVTQFGKEALAMPDYVLGVVKAGFIEGVQERLEWVRARHASYSAAELVQWFSQGDRATRAQVEDVLARAEHRDVLPMAAFR